MSKLSVVQLSEVQEKKARWPIDRVLENIEDYEEIVVIARKKDGEGYKRYSSALKSTFWWVRAIEALKRELMDESFVVTEDS